MKLTIISRFGRTDARRGGGIHKTAKLTSFKLKGQGVDVEELGDKLPAYDLSKSDVTWVYCADYDDILNNVLHNIAPTSSPVVVNSGWVPNVGRELWMKEVLARYSDKFENLLFSVWTKKAVQILSDNGFQGKVVFFPHLQSVSVDGSVLPGAAREGICIGELGKLSRSSLSSFNVKTFLKKLFDSGFSENVYAYAQYSSDKSFLGEFSDKVMLIEKLEQNLFFERLSRFKFFLWMTDKETFAAPPIEIASFGVVPILPAMPQSLSEYLPSSIFYSNEQAAVDSIVKYSSLDAYKIKSEEILLDIESLSLDCLVDIFYLQLLKLKHGNL